jgi:hypothetical protein
LDVDLLFIAEARGGRFGAPFKGRLPFRLMSSSSSSVRMRFQGFAPLGGRRSLPAGSGEISLRSSVTPNKPTPVRPRRSTAPMMSGRGGKVKWPCAFDAEPLVLLLLPPSFVGPLLPDVTTGVCAVEVDGVGTLCVAVGPGFVVGVAATLVVGVGVVPAIGVAVGCDVGVAVGCDVGVAVSCGVGVAVGCDVGVAVGCGVGVAVGCGVGVGVGGLVGVAVGGVVGVAVGGVVGVAVLPTVDWAGAAYELMLTHRNERTSNVKQSAPARVLMDVVWFMSFCMCILPRKITMCSPY